MCFSRRLDWPGRWWLRRGHWLWKSRDGRRLDWPRRWWLRLCCDHRLWRGCLNRLGFSSPLLVARYLRGCGCLGWSWLGEQVVGTDHRIVPRSGLAGLHSAWGGPFRDDWRYRDLCGCRNDWRHCRTWCRDLRCWCIRPISLGISGRIIGCSGLPWPGLPVVCDPLIVGKDALPEDGQRLPAFHKPCGNAVPRARGVFFRRHVPWRIPPGALLPTGVPGC